MSIGYKKQSAASVPTPPSGEINTFIDSADDILKQKDSTGTVSVVGSGTVPVAADVDFTPAGDITSTNVQDAIEELDGEKAPAAHVGAGGVSEHAVATGVAAGFLSPSDKTKLDGVAVGATANDTDANLKNRANHTGTQLAGTISNFDSAADTRVALHSVLTNNPHSVTKAQVGLGSVDNTADLAKPVSVAQAAADAQVLSDANAYTDTEVADAKAYADAAVAAVVNSAPALLDTLDELAAAIGDDNNFAATTATALGNRLRVDTDAQGLSSGEKLNAKTNIGLENVSNTSDANKPVSTAQATAIGLKANKAGDTFTGEIVVEGDNAGTGAMNLKAQSADPTTPASGVRLYANVDEKFTVKGQSSFAMIFNDQNLTGDREYSLPDADGILMIDPMTSIGDMIRRSASNITERLPAGAEDFILRMQSGLPGWVEENLLQDFGDASDGSVTISGSFTAPDVLYYDTLTLNAGSVFNPDAYLVYARILNLSNAPADAINRNGAAGTNVGANAGGAGGGAFTARVLATNGAGGAGAAGASNAGVQGAAGGAVTIGNGGNGGASGTSGAGGSGIAANGISGGVVTTNIHYGRFEYNFLRGGTQVSGGAGGRGGNSGGGDGANTSRGGGGGGAGGAVLVLIVGKIITSGSTAAGAISAKGGAGGRQTNAPASGNVGGAGGAGGGGGGYIYIAYLKKTGPSVTNLIDASGGNGGDGSNGLGTGLGGNGGAGGNGGRIQLFNVTDGIGSLTTGASGSLGATASGITGGTGGQGGACRVSL